MGGKKKVYAVSGVDIHNYFYGKDEIKAKKIMEHLKQAEEQIQQSKEQILIMTKAQREHMLELTKREAKDSVIARMYNVTTNRVSKILKEDK